MQEIFLRLVRVRIKSPYRGWTDMDTIDILQKVIDYIEENLKAEINSAELATIAGFSTYHFLHVFGSVVGMPLSAYTTRRRVKHAIYDIYRGGKLVDTALLYGFDTHAGFFKAFKREYGCSPSKFIKTSVVHKPVSVNLTLEAKLMLTQTQIRQLLLKWDIDTRAEIGTVHYYGGDIKAWNIGDSYVFKTGKNIVGLRTHISIANALAKEGMTAAYQIKTKDGQDFFQEGDRFYVLLNRIDGSYLTPEERYAGDREVTGDKYGKAIGKLHRILKKQDDGLEMNDNNLYNTVVNWAMPETKRIMEQWNSALPDEFYVDYETNFAKIYDKLPRHIIHRNPNPTNILFNGSEASGFIDFDISERNVRLFDPCYCATGILSEAGKISDGYEKWTELLQGIIKGYDSICPLSHEEKKAILYVIYSIQMIFIAWCNGRDEDKSIAMENRKMLVWIWENADKITIE
jgi:Ser/Thr protein kinase RdoA (MazF antagonist)/AraC-like DNA-binding protein